MILRRHSPLAGPGRPPVKKCIEAELSRQHRRMLRRASNLLHALTLLLHLSPAS